MLLSDFAKLSPRMNVAVAKSVHLSNGYRSIMSRRERNLASLAGQWIVFYREWYFYLTGRANPTRSRWSRRKQNAAVRMGDGSWVVAAGPEPNRFSMPLKNAPRPAIIILIDTRPLSICDQRVHKAWPHIRCIRRMAN